MSEWLPIESAHRDSRTVFVTDDGGTVSVAHFDEGAWWLGHRDDCFDVRIDHGVNYWLPWGYPTNPFKASLPAPPQTEE